MTTRRKPATLGAGGRQNHDSVVWFTDEKSDLWRVTNGQAGYWYPRTYNLKNLKGDYLLYGNVCSWD